MSDARKKILARRAQFMAAALASLSAGACHKEDAKPDASDVAPVPCLMPPYEPPIDAGQDAAAAADPIDAGSDATATTATATTATATTVTSTKKPVRPPPRPCLSIAPPSPKPASPKPCLESF